MNDRPKTFIVRLWSRSDSFRAEVKPLQGGEGRYFRSAADLIGYLEKQPSTLLSEHNK